MEFAVAFGPRAAVYGHGAKAADSFVSLDRFLTWEGARAARARRLASIHAANAWTTKTSDGLERPRARRFDGVSIAWRGGALGPNTVVEKGPSTVCLPCSCTPSGRQSRGSDVRIQTNTTGRGQFECRETGDKGGRRDLSVHCRVRVAGERGAEGGTAKNRVGLAGIGAVARGQGQAIASSGR